MGAKYGGWRPQRNVQSMSAIAHRGHVSIIMDESASRLLRNRAHPMEISNLLSPLLGGALIGLSASLLLVTLGRVAGISGIVGALSKPVAIRANWRLGFVMGLLAVGWLLRSHASLAVQFESAPVKIITAGLLVGIGTRLGSGCTSGHGVCGLSRFSKRSAVATGVFMATAMLVVAIARHALAGVTP